MEGSILTDIKKLLGLDEDYTQFDLDIIIHINSALMVLNQIGVGPEEGFSISDKSKKWSDYLGTENNLEAIKIYIYLKVRLMFDPPTSSFVLEAMRREVTELEWRLMVKVDPPIPEPIPEGDE